MLVSVAICTYNRSDLLEQTLERLCHVVVPEGASWELVVVDNASTDKTQDVLGGFANRLPLRVATEPKGGLSNARNCALNHVRGDYVLWTDDDVEVEPTWLAALVEGARRFPDATVFGGPVNPWFPAPPDPDLLDAFPALRLGFCGVDHERTAGPLPEAMNINGANMAFHRGRTASLRFDPAFGPTQTSSVVGDERNFIDRCRAAGGAVVWLPDLRVRHYVMPHRMSLGYLLQYYHDFAVTVTRREGPPSGARWLGVPRWVVREVIGSGLRATVLRPFLDRRAYLLALRSYWYNRGVAEECRAQARAGR
jgi:glycosyltransferase involved in cell wall biosynthesis